MGSAVTSGRIAIHSFLACDGFFALIHERSSSGRRSGELRGTPECGRRAAGPASKSAAEIGRITKSNREGDVVTIHRCLPQIPDCKLRSQLVVQTAKRNPLLRKTPTQSPLAYIQPASDSG
jgi:hypothetical protein